MASRSFLEIKRGYDAVRGWGREQMQVRGMLNAGMAYMDGETSNMLQEEA